MYSEYFSGLKYHYHHPLIPIPFGFFVLVKHYLNCVLVPSYCPKCKFQLLIFISQKIMKYYHIGLFLFVNTLRFEVKEDKIIGILCNYCFCYVL